MMRITSSMVHSLTHPYLGRFIYIDYAIGAQVSSFLSMIYSICLKVKLQKGLQL